MLLDSPTLTVPLQMDERGAIRVRGTRVTLDSLINFYRQGETAEALHDGFPTVALADIHAVIAYYLANQDDLDMYLERRADEADAILAEGEANLTPDQKAFNERVRFLAEEKRRNNGK